MLIQLVVHIISVLHQEYFIKQSEVIKEFKLSSFQLYNIAKDGSKMLYFYVYYEDYHAIL